MYRLRSSEGNRIRKVSMRSFALFAVVLFCVAADVDAQATTLPNTVLVKRGTR